MRRRGRKYEGLGWLYKITVYLGFGEERMMPPHQGSALFHTRALQTKKGYIRGYKRAIDTH
jgi:hypothetical protein